MVKQKSFTKNSGIICIARRERGSFSIDLAHELRNRSSESVCIILEEGAVAQIRYEDGRVFSGIKSVAQSVHFIIRKNAHLTFIHDQCSGDIEVTTKVVFELDMQSKLVYQGFISGNVELQLDVILKGENASAELYGAYLLDAKQSVAITTRQLHYARNSSSNVFFKGLLQGNACASYYGTVFIDKKAAGSSAYQGNKTILLSDQARMISRPRLQILNNDVQCGHGSAVGQLDKEQLVYAQTRGLSKRQAQKFLIEGFFTDIFVVESRCISNFLGGKLDNV